MRESKEKLMADRDSLTIQLSVLDSRRRLVESWLDAVKNVHQPYSHALDMSCVRTEDMKENLAKRLEKDLWCNECSNPWPCRRLEQLQVLEDILRNRDNGAATRDELRAKINDITPHERPGIIPVRL